MVLSLIEVIPAQNLPVFHMGDCQSYGPFLGPYYNTGPNTGPNLGDPKRDHNFDNPPYLEPWESNPDPPSLESPKHRIDKSHHHRKQNAQIYTQVRGKCPDNPCISPHPPHRTLT